MAQRAPTRESAPAEVIAQISGGINGYTDPTITKPQQWAAALNCFSGQFGTVQRCRFANLHSFTPATGQAFKTLKYYAIPGVGAYLLGDLAGKLWSFDTSTAGYAKTQRFNPYIDPTGSGSGIASLAGPWSREVLQNIVYEMNGFVKQTGRLANAATIESFGLDAPDSSPQVTIFSGTVQTITSITRLNGVVTATLAGAFTVPGGNGIGFLNVLGVTDTSFNGTFVVQTGSGTASLTWNQAGQNTTSSPGTVDSKITKSVGRSYAWAWENANKNHVSAPSPATQFLQYVAQFGEILPLEPGTVTTSTLSTLVTGTGTQFTSAWIGRSLWVNSAGSVGRIVAVASATSLTLAANATANVGSGAFQVYDISSTHLRLYETADGGATYFRVSRNAFNPAATTTLLAGLDFLDSSNAEPPNFPFTTETSQVNNLPPPIGPFLNEYQNRLLVYGIQGANQTFFYSNIETTNIGLAQESFAPLNQITLPISNGQINGMLEFPGSLIIWSDKQDMFRLTGLLTDNVVSTSFQQGASISRLPYAMGCASPFAADITPLGGIWLTSNAEIQLYTDRYAPRNIGLPVQDILNTISPANLNLSRAKYFHANKRNWFALSVAANGSNFCNTVLICDIDLLSSNGAPSYFTFDMATNSPVWYVFQVGTSTTTHSISDSATLIQSNGGGLAAKYQYDFGSASLNGTVYTVSIYVVNQGPTAVTVRSSGSAFTGITVDPGHQQQVTLQFTGDGFVHPTLRFDTANAGDAMSIVCVNPSIVPGLAANIMTGSDLIFTGAKWSAISGAVVTLTQNQAIGTPIYTLNPRSDSIEVVYETGGRVRLLIGGLDLIQDADYRPGSSGSEIIVPNALIKTHPWGNDSPFIIKRPSFIRFDTKSDPSLLAALGWSFAVEGIDDDFYTFDSPLILQLLPGINDTSSLCGNPNLSGGESFRHSPCLYRIGGVNFVAGRRLRFQANFPVLAGDDYQLQAVQIGFGPSPPR